MLLDKYDINVLKEVKEEFVEIDEQIKIAWGEVAKLVDMVIGISDNRDEEFEKYLEPLMAAFVREVEKIERQFNGVSSKEVDKLSKEVIEKIRMINNHRLF